MPVITFKYQDLKDLGIDMEKDELINTLPMMSSDIEDFDDEEIKVEFFPNRPDNLSVEGVARSFKGFINQETGLPKYEVAPSDESVIVDAEVAKIRPYIAFAKIEGVDFTGDKLKYIMDFQENLHWVIGRDRKKVAIGIHNADVVSQPFHYIATPNDENAFVALEKDTPMTPEEVLTQHEKGVAYAHLLEDFDKYPLILDKDNQVLSMPPIINGELTKIDENVKNIIVDVTGTDERAVNQCLNIICSSFAEVGGKIKSMEIKKIKQNVISYNKKDDSGNGDSGKDDNMGSDGKPSGSDGDNSGNKTGDSSGSGDASGESGIANIKNSDEFSQNLGTNSSDYYQKYESLSGKDAMAKGDQSAAKSSDSSGSPSDDGSSKEGKSYELVSPNKISKVIQNTSGVIILAIIALLVLFIIGYKRKNKM